MAPSSKAKEYPLQYLAASFVSASINYPLWRASAIGQSGFRVGMNSIQQNLLNLSVINGITIIPTHTVNRIPKLIPSFISPYVYAFVPPYKGMVGVVLGMTWARGAIFWGSDYGRDVLRNSNLNIPTTITTLLPPFVVSTLVQIINQPIVRASITIQNPESKIPNTISALKYIYKKHGGLSGLWHGTSAGILKSVPKYCTAILVKDYIENYYFKNYNNNNHHQQQSKGNNNNNNNSNNNSLLLLSNNQQKLLQSAFKSCVAGLAGAALTNPLDVIRNEMFKTNKPLIKSVQSLYNELGLYKLLTRGMGKNLIAVSIPIASTIFFTDVFITLSTVNK